MENDRKTVVGKKQILRLLKENSLQSVRVATDVEADYAESILAAAKQYGTPAEVFGTRQQIADAFGIEVPCGAVGFLKNDVSL